jgi:hypothetical protein
MRYPAPLSPPHLIVAHTVYYFVFYPIINIAIGLSVCLSSPHPLYLLYDAPIAKFNDPNPSISILLLSPLVS